MVKKKCLSIVYLLVHNFAYAPAEMADINVSDLTHIPIDTILECKEYEWSEQNIGETIEKNIKHLQEQAKKVSE